MIEENRPIAQLEWKRQEASERPQQGEQSVGEQLEAELGPERRASIQAGLETENSSKQEHQLQAVEREKRTEEK